MHILFTAYTIDPSGGSEGRNAWHWIQGAIQHGHTVTVITEPLSAHRVSSALKALDNIDVRIIEQKIRFCKLPYLFGFSMFVQYLSWQREISKTLSKNRVSSIDVAHHLSWGSLNLGSGLSQCNVPYIFGPNGGGTLALKGSKTYLGFQLITEGIRVFINKLLQRTKWSRLSVTQAEIILATNDDAVRLAQKMGGNRIIKFLAEGIDASQVKSYSDTSDSKQIVWVGRFLPIKGANLAVRSFDELLKKVPDARLIMVGEGPRKKSVEKLVKKFDITEKVLFTGQVSWNQVQEYYQDAKLLLFSSIRDSTGAQVLEAAAKGKPVVSCPGLGVNEWIEAPARISGGYSNSVSLVESLTIDLYEAFKLSEAQLIEASAAAISYANTHNWLLKQQSMNNLYLEIYTKNTNNS